MSEQPSFAAAWLRQREAGGRAVAVLETDELRNLDVAEALRLADALLEATPIEAMAESRRTTSGLIEQQRLFMLLRR